MGFEKRRRDSSASSELIWSLVFSNRFEFNAHRNLLSTSIFAL